VMETVLMSVPHLTMLAAGSVVSAIWESALVVACVAVCLRLLPGITAAARSIVWSGVFLLLVLFPFVGMVGGSGAMGRGVGLHVDVRWAWALVGGWALLGLVRAAQLVRSAVHLRGISRRAVAVTLVDDLEKVGVACEGVSSRRGVELCVSDEVSVPSVVGFFAPRILLPPGLLASMSGAELQQIVLHEMEHLRRWDDWTNLLQKVGLVMFPLNPALLWVERRLCRERELACDDGVLRATGARKAYAICLANLAEQSMIRRGVSLALGAWERQSELARRIHRILRRPEGEMGRGQTVAMMSVMLVGMAVGLMELGRAPQLVSFNSGARVAGAVSVSARPAGTNFEAVAATPSARAVMVKAVMPQKRVRAAAVVDTRAGVSRVPNASESRQRRPLQSSETLVEWRQESARAAMALTFSQDSQFTYAAIRVPDGWLIVQL